MKVEFSRLDAEYEVGEAIGVRTPALDPFTIHASTLVGLEGTAQVFAPGKDPANVVADRGAPDASGDFAYEEGTGYVAWVDTVGLAPGGEWTLRVRLHDADGEIDFDCVEYRTFTLRE